MDHGNVQFVTMNQNSKPELLSMWRLSMCSRRDTVAPFVRSFVPLTMHLNFTSRDIIDNMFKNLALIMNLINVISRGRDSLKNVQI